MVGGNFYLLFPKTCLGSRVLIDREEDICQAGHVVDSRHLFVSTRFDKSDVKHFSIVFLACLGEGWSPLTSKQITLHIGELEAFFACFSNILERGFTIEGNHSLLTDT